MVGGGSQASSHFVRIGLVGVAEDLHGATVMCFQNAGEQEADGMVTEIAGEIADAQASGRRSVVEMFPGRRRVVEMGAEAARRGKQLRIRNAGVIVLAHQEVAMRPGEFGLQGHGPFEASLGVFQLAQVDEDIAENCMALGVARRQLERPPVGHDGFVQPALIPQRVAEIIVRRSEIRIAGQRPAVAFDALGQIALVLEDGSEIVVRGA